MHSPPPSPPKTGTTFQPSSSSSLVSRQRRRLKKEEKGKEDKIGCMNVRKDLVVEVGPSMLHGPKAYFPPFLFSQCTKRRKRKRRKKRVLKVRPWGMKDARTGKKGKLQGSVSFFSSSGDYAVRETKGRHASFSFPPFFATMFNERWKLH